MNRSQIRNIILVALALALLASSRAIASLTIEYSWWSALGQFETWLRMLLYKVLPAAAVSLIAWLALLWAHGRGIAFAGAPANRYSWYSKLVPVVFLVVAIVFVGTSVNHWTVMAYVGSRGIDSPPDAWTDPVFGLGLPFYLFELPFYSLLLRVVFVVAVFSRSSSGRQAAAGNCSSVYASSATRGGRSRNSIPVRTPCCCPERAAPGLPVSWDRWPCWLWPCGYSCRGTPWP